MKLLAWMLILSFSLAFAQDEKVESSQEITQAGEQKLFRTASGFFAQGKYSAAVTELSALEKNPGLNKATSGLLSYWKGLCYNRLQDFPQAIASFDRALSYDYKPVEALQILIPPKTSWFMR